MGRAGLAGIALVISVFVHTGICLADEPCGYLRDRRNPTAEELSECRARDPFGTGDPRHRASLPGYFTSELPDDELQKKRYEKALNDVRRRRRSPNSSGAPAADLDTPDKDQEFGFEARRPSRPANTEKMTDLRDKIHGLDPDPPH